MPQTAPKVSLRAEKLETAQHMSRAVIRVSALCMKCVYLFIYETPEFSMIGSCHGIRAPVGELWDNVRVALLMKGQFAPKSKTQHMFFLLPAEIFSHSVLVRVCHVSDMETCSPSLKLTGTPFEW